MKGMKLQSVRSKPVTCVIVHQLHRQLWSFMRKTINILYLLRIGASSTCFVTRSFVRNPLSWRLMQEAKLIYFTTYHNVDGEEN